MDNILGKHNIDGTIGLAFLGLAFIEFQYAFKHNNELAVILMIGFFLNAVWIFRRSWEDIKNE